MIRSGVYHAFCISGSPSFLWSFLTSIAIQFKLERTCSYQMPFDCLSLVFLSPRWILTVSSSVSRQQQNIVYFTLFSDSPSAKCFNLYCHIYISSLHLSAPLYSGATEVCIPGDTPLFMYCGLIKLLLLKRSFEIYEYVCEHFQRQNRVFPG